jgi:4'-phosphopantetheinyl transferase
MAADEVRIWRASLVEWLERPLQSRDLEILSKGEHGRAGRILVEDARRRYLISRVLSRRVLASCIDDDPARIHFDTGPHGKPHLRGHDRIHFNISHSPRWWVMAVAQDRDVGIDVEDLDRKIDIERVAARLFVPEEIAVIESLEGEDRRRAFFRVWTSREAVVKAMGEGIFASGRKFVVEADPKEPARVHGDAFLLREIPIDDGSLCSVAAVGGRPLQFLANSPALELRWGKGLL